MLFPPTAVRDRLRDGELEDAHTFYLVEKSIARGRYQGLRDGDGDGLDRAIDRAREDYAERVASIRRYWSRPWRALWSRTIVPDMSIRPQEAVSDGRQA